MLMSALEIAEGETCICQSLRTVWVQWSSLADLSTLQHCRSSGFQSGDSSPLSGWDLQSHLQPLLRGYLHPSSLSLFGPPTLSTTGTCWRLLSVIFMIRGKFGTCYICSALCSGMACYQRHHFISCGDHVWVWGAMQCALLLKAQTRRESNPFSFCLSASDIWSACLLPSCFISQNCNLEGWVMAVASSCFSSYYVLCFHFVPLLSRRDFSYVTTSSSLRVIYSFASLGS